MAQRKKHADRFSESGSVLKNVEIFTSGVHRGKNYSDADLDAMVDNFRKFSTGNKPLLRVPAVLGHEEDQQFLDRSDLPAAAWATHVYREGHILKADFSDVPDQIADLIRTKRYRTISSEVYDEPPESIPGKGKMLRRVAMLGSDIPQIKNLADIPLPSSHREQFASGVPTFLRFREVKPTPGVPGCFSCFAEVTAMDPTQLLQQLQDMGFDVSAFQQLPPEVLQSIIDGAQAMQAAQNDDKTVDQPDPNIPDDPANAKGFSDAFAFTDFDDDLPDAGSNDASMYADKARAFADQVKKYAARAMKMMEKYCGMKPVDPAMPAKNADAPSASTPVTDPVGIMTAPPPNPKKVTMTHQYSEDAVKKLIADAKAEIKAEFAGIKEQTDALEANTRRASIVKFCEGMVEKGILLPAQLDPGDPKNPRWTVIDRLFAIPPDRKVTKFAEGGKKVTITELQAAMDEIETGPRLRKYGESMVKTSGSKSDADAEKEKVKEHFEQFRERFEVAGVTQETYLKAFESQQKRDRELTAEKYTGMGRKAG
jgi:hypothetical protein